VNARDAQSRLFGRCEVARVSFMRMMLVRDLRDESERQYKSRKRDNPHRLLHTTMDQIRKTIPDGLPTGV
jgi:hypothetical protein